MNTAEEAVRATLQDITDGAVIVRDETSYPASVRRYGAEHAATAPSLVILSPDAYEALLSGSIAFGEGYMRRQWDTDSLADLLGVMLRNRLSSRAYTHIRRLPFRVQARILGAHASGYLSQSLASWRTHPAFRFASARNARRHYDLGNAFYERMLDPTMTYSCGYIADGSYASLEDMQHAKYALIARKLRLTPGDRLLDIGCGWGGMLAHAATHHGVRGVGVTLSAEQYAWMRRPGVLPPGISVRLQDYRAIPAGERFDKIVSIGMFEHVGKRQYPVFMRTVERLLSPGGRVLLHTIAREESRYRLPPDPWIRKYIFPGGRLPYLSEILREMARAGFVLDASVGIEDLRPHYAETLRHWHANVQRNWADIRRIDPQRFDETFRRMWSFYLQASEAGFRHGGLHLYQVPFTKQPG